MGVAEKVTAVPEQIVPLGLAVNTTLGVTFVETVSVIVLLLAEFAVWQTLFAVNTQTITSLFAGGYV